ncbi:MAG: imidazole glycerol phosphate synthase subunit HisF [Candidatus Methanoplasma sp.]|jgi:cyclase|nr:imidazole glycerol phosphate synthase subunit HisF [Candidatus Methanoplasma sp.]
MSPKKIIPCLDVKDGKVVKGVNFVDMTDIGSPPQLAEEYCAQGADEITLLDITATLERRETFFDLVSETAKRISVPLAVGGGMRSADEMSRILKAGADKVSINTAAVMNPGLIRESAERFGKERIIVAIDAKKTRDSWDVVTHGGTKTIKLDAVEWARKVEDLGAGEILLTSVDADGVKNGYDIPLNKAVADAVGIPVTASGGCGKIEDFFEVLSQTNVSSALAASVFHYKQFTVKEVKQYLKDRGVRVR